MSTSGRRLRRRLALFLLALAAAFVVASLDEAAAVRGALRQPAGARRYAAMPDGERCGGGSRMRCALGKLVSAMHWLQSYVFSWDPTGMQAAGAALAVATTTVTYTCASTKVVGGSTYKDDGAWRICLDKMPTAAMARLRRQRAEAQGGDAAAARDVEAGAKCIVYSVGIADDWSFDDAMAREGCRVFSFDPSLGKQDHDTEIEKVRGVNFYSIGLGGKDSDDRVGQKMVKWSDADKHASAQHWKVRTLDSLMTSFRHDHVDILKFDVEGFEWEILAQLLASSALGKVQGLLFEVHFWSNFDRSSVIEQHFPDGSKHNPASLRRWAATLRGLSAAGFELQQSHTNKFATREFLLGNGATQPCCYELSFVRTRQRSG